MKTVSIKLPSHLREAIESEAKLKRISKSEVIRLSLEERFNAAVRKKPNSFYDVARKYVGIYKGGPRDLSTNTKYMEGFGQ